MSRSEQSNSKQRGLRVNCSFSLKRNRTFETKDGSFHIYIYTYIHISSLRLVYRITFVFSLSLTALSRSLIASISPKSDHNV